MANNTNFISPGYYSRIEDLSRVTVAVGVTTLGVVGETLKGAAFQPTLVANKNEYFKKFGGQSPIKNGTNLKYELSYIANSFLEESTSLYVTRILGLNGYEAKSGSVISFKVGSDTFIYSTLRHDTGVVVALEGTGNTFESTKIKVTVDTVSTVYNVSFIKGASDYIGLVLPRVKTGKFYLENIFEFGETIPDATVTILKPIVNKGDFAQQYRYAVTPMIVSDKSTGVKDLFTIMSISDGNSANTEFKVSFENIRIDRREFDVVIRSFSDKDKSPVVLEAFRGCNMNPMSSNYIAKRIGSFDDTYKSLSSYIMVDVVESAPITAVPAGFKGYKALSYDADIVYPVGFKLAHIGSSPRELRQSYLGYDFDANSVDFLQYQGYDDNGISPIITKGFHMEDLSDHINASMYEFNIGASLSGSVYENLLSRRFSVAVAGGYDAWDVHASSLSFDKVVKDDGSYEAYIAGLDLMMNPDDLPINILATAGIDFSNQNSLVLETLDKLEEERGDCIYVINAPDIDSESYDKAEVYASDLVSRLDGANIDSMFGCTFGSWVKHYDSQNGVNVWISPVHEVLRNMAETDRKRAPWFSAAGWKNGKLKSEKAKVKLNELASDILYQDRINPIRTFTNSPLLILGNKNLMLDEESALNRINIVRLLIQIQKLVSVVAVRMLFDPNDDNLQDEFIASVTPILDNVRQQRGIIDYQIVCDSSNNSDADRDRLQLNGYIRIKPTLALEYINVTYGVTDQGAQFSF